MKNRFWFLFLLLASFALSSQVHAQADWFEDEDDEEELVDGGEAWDIAAGDFNEVKVRLNGEDVELGGEYSFGKNDTLDIKVRHLAPGSGIVLKVEKGGISLKKKAFYANSRGQLDLEVRTGGKKVSGGAVIYYTTSSGRKVEREVKISIK